MKKTFYTLIFIILLFPHFCIAENQKIKVGLFVPLSGPIAEYGLALQTGIEIFQKKHPKLADKFEILIEDSKYEARTAVSIFRKFTEIIRSMLCTFGVRLSQEQLRHFF